MIKFLKELWNSFVEIRRERERLLFELKSYRETSTWLSDRLTQTVKELNVADTEEEKAVKSSELRLYMSKSATELKNLRKFLTDLKKTGRINFLPHNKQKCIFELISTLSK